MTIISVSVNDTILKDIKKMQDEYGYSGRSEVIRAATRMLLSEHKTIENIQGEMNAILIVIHNHEYENMVSQIKHEFKDITKTQIHSHFEKEKCLELFVLQGDANSVKEMTRQFIINKKMDVVKLITP